MGNGLWVIPGASLLSTAAGHTAISTYGSLEARSNIYAAMNRTVPRFSSRLLVLSPPPRVPGLPRPSCWILSMLSNLLPGLVHAEVRPSASGLRLN
ncbi:hypothetical protein F4778DRAFT_690670 [Xylariomycetidae sp. FL2044]|nr:hypothetical protein F4778DRAFT_690670 [Xylariomycetidae sp. FL2044]